MLDGVSGDGTPQRYVGLSQRYWSMVMDQFVALKPKDVVPDRPFTDLALNLTDLAAVRQMIGALREIVAARPREALDGPRPVVLNWPQPEGRMHRVVIAHYDGLIARCDLAIVGFFGDMRPGADSSVLDGMDELLIGEFVFHKGVLSYSTLELADGNCGNLVLLNPPQARDHWRASAKHASAVNIAPQYYADVRLHNGTLPGGLIGGGEPVLTRTKYYDFARPEPWYAVRDL